MNRDSKLQAAIARRIDDTYSDGVDGIHERLDDDATLAAAFIERYIINAHPTSPRWRDKPTCAGLWAFPATQGFRIMCTKLTENEILIKDWQRPCFGPIPERTTG